MRWPPVHLTPPLFASALLAPPLFVPALAAALALAAGCDAGKTKQLGANHLAPSCEVVPGAPPAGTASFYKKYLDGNGIPVQSSAAVSDAALQAACTIVVRMLNKRDDVRQVMIGQQMRVAVIGENEVTTDVPEYANLNQMFPQQDWDRLRGVGATLLIPVSSVGAENLLCLAGDFFDGEQILVQTFATAVLLGMEEADSTFDSRLRDAYDAAISAGLWRNTYAAANTIEYYAAGGVQTWFESVPDLTQADGTHNEINTRAELRAYDPTLAALVGETMPDDSWRPKCP
jgi:hypothetical protein